LQGDLIFGLVPVTTKGEKGEQTNAYAFMAGTPVAHEDKRVGSVAIFSFISDRYLEYQKRNVGADLALTVNGKLIASTKGHPAPDLRAAADEVVFKEDGSRAFAVKTFVPQGLQRQDFAVELTASRDVSEIQAAARRGLYRQLGMLG